MTIVRPWLNIGPSEQPSQVVRNLERHYKGIFLGDYTLRDSLGNWIERPAMVFYVPRPNISLGHSHYLGIWPDYINQTAVLADASVISEVVWHGAIGQNNEVVFSRFRHDCRTTMDETSMIDGGQDYCRGAGQWVGVMIDGLQIARMLVGLKAEASVRDPNRLNVLYPEDFDKVVIDFKQESAHERMRAIRHGQKLFEEKPKSSKIKNTKNKV